MNAVDVSTYGTKKTGKAAIKSNELKGATNSYQPRFLEENGAIKAGYSDLAQIAVVEARRIFYKTSAEAHARKFMADNAIQQRGGGFGSAARFGGPGVAAAAAAGSGFD